MKTLLIQTIMVSEIGGIFYGGHRRFYTTIATALSNKKILLVPREYSPNQHPERVPPCATGLARMSHESPTKTWRMTVLFSEL